MIFQDRVSLVTGASQGIGESIARELAREGAAVVLVDVQKAKLETVAQAIAAEGGQADVDHLVNNAGITRDNLFMRMKEEDWDAVIGVNLKGVFNFTKAVIRSMISARYGRIVNLSSVVGLMGNAGQTNYAASKAGLIGFTKALARETASRNVTVNCVAPGYIATPMTLNLPEAVKKWFIDIIPMGRFGEPADVARAVRFLCSDDAAYITGQIINVNGGMYM